MQNGECPRCHARTVYRATGTGFQSGLTAGDSTTFVRLHREGEGWLPDTEFLALTPYLCRSCGLVETYVKDVERLERLDDYPNWTPIE